MLLSEKIKTMENEHKELEMCPFGELKIPRSMATFTERLKELRKK